MKDGRVYSIADQRFERQFRRPGGLSRAAAIKRAEAELERVRPELSNYIMTECQRLDAALSAAATGNDPQQIALAHECSQNLRDVAETMGYPLLGFVARSLCAVFEATRDGQLPYPADIITCHLDALRLAQQPAYRDKTSAQLQDLSAGLTRATQIVTKLTTLPPKPTADDEPTQ